MTGLNAERLRLNEIRRRRTFARPPVAQRTRRVEVEWAPRDRVILTPTGQPQDRVTGTVTAVDDHGVHVALDRPILGSDTAYATSYELVRAPSTYEAEMPGAPA